MMEIFVGHDIEKALTSLKQKYKRDLAKDVLRHSYYLSPRQRKRLKHLKAISRLRRLASRSILRTSEAIRREAHGQRQARMDHVRP